MFQRAALYLRRKSRKAFILLLVLTVSATLVLTCLSIGRAADQALKELRERMGGYFKVETDIYEGFSGIVSNELVDSVMRNGGIKTYNDMDLQFMMADSFELLPGRFTMEQDERAHLTRVIGNSESSLSEYFLLQYFTLTEGRHIARDDTFKAVISEKLAALNHISVGDFIDLQVYEEDLPAGYADAPGVYPYEIVGLYRNDSQENISADTAECNMADNFIFTDANAPKIIHKDMTGMDADLYRQGVAFFVDDPREMDAIVEGMQSIDGFQWKSFKITENNTTYEKASVPLERMAGISTATVIIVIIVSAVILTLILLMWMKDRVTETGVLMSIGIQKVSIVGQHVVENLLVALIAFLLAWGLAGTAAGGVSALFVDSSAEMETAEDTAYKPQEDLIEEIELETGELIEVHVGLEEWLTLAGAGFVLVTVATGIASLLIVRMKPKDILTLMS